MNLLLLALVQPQRAAGIIKSNPRWIVQFLILAVLSIILAVLAQPYVVHLTLDRLPSSATAEDKFIVQQALDGELYVRCAFLPIRLLIGWASFALLLFYACKGWRSKESVRFYHLWSLEVTAESVMVLAQAASLIYALTGGGSSFMRIPFGLDMVFGPLADPVKRMALNSVNIFALGYLYLLTTGISVLYGQSKIKSFFPVLAVWSLSVMFNVGIVSLLRDAFSFRL
ncbi:MAG TPA: hypothetical protein VGR15_05620 [Bacteroidota bacterium]|nr:hypothetical protein [Bacteroidota bacterium]